MSLAVSSRELKIRPGRRDISFGTWAGACLLAGAALLPHAPARPVLAGMAVAGVIHYAWLRLSARRNGGR